MSTKPNQEFKVRLSRTSSAQAILKKERKKSSIFKVDDIIDDDRSTDTVTGRLPTEAAYVIMKRVTAEVGHPLNPAGISTYNKLQSLKTSPAVELLQQKTWREFFSKKTAAHVSMAKNPKVINTDNDFSLLNRTVSAEEMHKRHSEARTHLIQMFDRLVARVEQLWTELKIPHADQVFYRKSLCKGPPQSVEQCREIAAYIASLKVHHDATVNVILAIQTREMAIAKCFDVLAALQRKFSRTNQREATLGATVPTLRSSFSAQLNFHGGAATSRSDQDGGGGSSFWKEELIVALDDVRSCSLEVIKRVQTWRRNLWRPHPFVYMGVNYVAKMKDDLSILESDIYTKLLALIPLKFADLQCIVFFSNAGKTAADTHGASGQGHYYGHQSTAGGGGGSPARPPAHPFSPSMDHLSSIQPGRTNSINSQNGEIYIQQLLQEFLHKVNPRELQLAATIVLEEETLQNALAIEHASLLSKGVFIPTLHTRGGQSGAEKVVARPVSSTHSSFLQSGGGTNHHDQAADDYHHHHHEMQQHSSFAPHDPSQQVEHRQEEHHGHGQQPLSRDEEAVDWTPDFAA